MRRLPFVIVAVALAAVGLPAPAQAGPGPLTAFTIEGEPGAYIGQGIPQYYAPPSSSFSTADQYQTTTKEWVFLRIWGETGAAKGHWWYVNLAAAPGQELALGSYTGTVNAHARGPGQPGLDIFGDGAGCDHYGKFTLHELSWVGNTLERFAASYEFTCDANPQRYAGEVRYQSTVAFRAITTSPTAVAFADTLVGKTSATTTLTVRNPGTLPLTVSAVKLGGTNPASFEVVSQTCTSGPIAAKGTCSATIRFAPTAAGDRNARLRITDDTSIGLHEVPLSGIGIKPYVHIAIENSRPAFGAIDLGTTSTAAISTVTSAGTIPLQITSVKLGGTNPGDFVLVGQTCTAGPLDPRETCAITTKFRPEAVGTRAATLSLTTNTPQGTHTLVLTGSGRQPVSAVSWGPIRMLGPAYTWNAGGALARTTPTASSERLHSIYASPRIGSAWNGDKGPYRGVWYVRSSDKGATWSTPFRLNPTTQHGDRVALAAAGSYVYTAWVSQTKVATFDPKAPRALYVRVNSNHGASASWRAAVRLTSTSGRVDYPTLAASGANVYVTWVDSVTGALRVARSIDRGAHWSVASIGTATATDAEGRWGDPSVAAAGSTVVVAWNATPTTIKARVSASGGASWGAATTMTSVADSIATTAARGERVIVGWSTASVTQVRLRLAATWLPVRTVADRSRTWCPAVALQGTSQVGVAYSKVGDAAYGDGSDLYWVESTDNGAVWHVPQRLATIATTKARRSNDWPSVVWATTDTRYVAFNGWTTQTGQVPGRGVTGRHPRV